MDIQVALVAQYCKWLKTFITAVKYTHSPFVWEKKQQNKQQKTSLFVFNIHCLKIQKHMCPSTSIHCFSMERNRNFPWCLHIGLNKLAFDYSDVSHCTCEVYLSKGLEFV